MTAQDIISAADSAATWCSLHQSRDALACYMLRAVGHLPFEEIAAEMDLESRRDVLQHFNAIGVSRLTGESDWGAVMTPRARPLSENGKVIAICLLFPLLWPFLPVVLACMGIEKIRDAYLGWKYRRTRVGDHENP